MPGLKFNSFISIPQKRIASISILTETDLFELDFRASDCDSFHSRVYFNIFSSLNKQNLSSVHIQVNMRKTPRYLGICKFITL